MPKISRLFLSLIIVCGFALAQDTGNTQNQTDPSANGKATTQPKKKHKKKKKSIPATEQPNTMNSGQTSTSQGTGQPPKEHSVPPPNTPENRAPQADGAEPPPAPATPPQ
ncbi:MAG TPA: hypothetical protein VH088_20525 [Terriglobales bacterium]|nr:hypothetical protein [Terriglobales bacterium]